MSPLIASTPAIANTYCCTLEHKHTCIQVCLWLIPQDHCELEQLTTTILSSTFDLYILLPAKLCALSLQMRSPAVCKLPDAGVTPHTPCL